MVSEYGISDVGTCDVSGFSKTSSRYSGPVRVIKTSVQWQNAERGPYCSHILKRMHLDDRGGITDTLRPHPLTARVSLVAKLSTGDEHLDREAAHYEGFPEHLFEHWTGYNMVAPLYEPTPVNAVIPQYYGYYEFDTPTRGMSMSPILLMENCGKQISLDDLNMDDAHECAALVYKFHEAGYLHNSVFSRNMLCQEGPLDRPMYQRGTGEFMEDGRKHAYRLIDFGRSEKSTNKGERNEEELAVKYLLS
ncbi:hypothetical protein APHAL10511_008623 [Amanita phalloides]|nr:hypothetical protein APHAL10511_008623 [Amanita phalloides]